MSKRIEYKLRDGSFNVIYGIENWTIDNGMLMVKTKTRTHYILLRDLVSYDVER